MELEGARNIAKPRRNGERNRAEEAPEIAPETVLDITEVMVRAKVGLTTREATGRVEDVEL